MQTLLPNGFPKPFLDGSGESSDRLCGAVMPRRGVGRSDSNEVTRLIRNDDDRSLTMCLTVDTLVY